MASSKIPKSLAKEVSELTQTGSGTITRHESISGGTLDGMKCQRYGDTVFMSGRIYGIDTIANGPIFRVSSGYRPITVQSVMGYINVAGGTASIPLLLNVTPEGTITVGYSSTIHITQCGFAGVIHTA